MPELELTMPGSQQGFNFGVMPAGMILGNITDIILGTPSRFFDDFFGVNWRVFFENGEDVSLATFDTAQVQAFYGLGDFVGGRVTAEVDIIGDYDLTLGDLLTTSWVELFALGDDQISLTAFDDVISTGLGNDFVAGLQGDDTILGGAGNDFLKGQTGDDTLDGGAGRDSLNGGFGADTMIGGGSHDRMFGGAGSDTMFGNAGVDRMRGDGGSDAMFGGAGRDFLRGNGGADTLDGGAGNDRLTGGRGVDTFIYNGGRDVIFDHNVGETITVTDVAPDVTVAEFLSDNANIRRGDDFIRLIFDDGDVLTLVGRTVATISGDLEFV